jgi:hypothetical protein
MTAFEMSVIGTALFFLLVALLQWSYRSTQNAARLERLSRVLRQYLVLEGNESSAEAEEAEA